MLVGRCRLCRTFGGETRRRILVWGFATRVEGWMYSGLGCIVFNFNGIVSILHSIYIRLDHLLEVFGYVLRLQLTGLRISFGDSPFCTLSYVTSMQFVKSLLLELAFWQEVCSEAECCNPLLDYFLCDSRSLLLAVLCLFWPYMGPPGPPLARHPSQPIATLQHYGSG